MPPTSPSTRAATTPLPAHTRVAIVGSGFAGLGLAMRLRHEGYDDFVVFEKADDVGGTWRDNTYPGAACDIPSHLYSFSFAPNADWTQRYSKQPEILDYLRRCVDQAGLWPHIRLGHAVETARWDDDAGVWHVTTSQGALTADVLVGAMGPLSKPSVPDLPGLDTFAGPTFHSATWDHEVDLSGKRVAVVGTGASAIQFVPEIQPVVGELHLFQRTPPWVLPRADREISPPERRLLRAVPPLRRALRTGLYWAHEIVAPALTGNRERWLRRIEGIAKAHLKSQVADPALRAKLTPDYTLGCKRILMSNDYYRALTRPNVEVVASGVAEVRPHAVVASDGTEREVDAIVFGTGFHVTDFPGSDSIVGRDGRSMRDVWSERGMEAYLGTAVAGFPNAFLVIGPNTGLGHNSMVFMMEAQFTYILDCLRTMDRTGVATVEVRPEAVARYNDELQRDLEGTVWSAGGCRSWYLDDRGRNTTLWPGLSWAFRRRTRAFDPHSYTLRHRPAVAVTARAAGPTTPEREPEPVARP